MKPMVAELVTNEECLSFFLLEEDPQVRLSKKNKEYLCLKLQDKTGIVEGRVWDIPQGLDIATLKQGAFVKVRGQVSEWQEQKQLSISQIRPMSQDDWVEVELGDFFERSAREPGDLFRELAKLVKTEVWDKYVEELLVAVLHKNEEKLLLAPAAKSVHHCYVGGLLEHVLSMCHTAVALSDHYSLNKDLMIAACVLHDIGKIRELTFPVGIGYSLEGTLIGHISIGMQMVSDEIAQIDNFPQDKKIAILHLVASHHGLLAYGSPKVPMMREAIAFHLVDMLDSKLAICARVLKKGTNDLGLSEWSKYLDSFIWKGPE